MLKLILQECSFILSIYLRMVPHGMRQHLVLECFIKYAHKACAGKQLS